jgi:hypothetical protein
MVFCCFYFHLLWSMPLPKMTQTLDKEMCWLSVFQTACNTNTLLPGL